MPPSCLRRSGGDDPWRTAPFRRSPGLPRGPAIHRFRTIAKASTSARGYGAAHTQARQTFAAKHRPTDPCTRCGRPLGPMGRHLHLDHNAARTGYLGFAHGSCNVVAGAKAGRARQDTTRLQW